MAVCCLTATKRIDLFLYICTWYSESGYQGSNCNQYIALIRVSLYVLNSMCGACSGHQMPSYP